MKIEISKVTKKYSPEKAALEQVSFSVESGEFISVIGQSGAGKSTLLKILNGSVKSTSGEYIFDGQNFNKLSSRKKRKIQSGIATIYQDFCLVEETSALVNVLNAFLPQMSFLEVLFSIFSKDKENFAKDALSKVGLNEKFYEKVKNLSGGEKQRVAVAKAICQNANLILADEPSSSLDPSTTEKVLEILQSFSREGKIVIMNCHSPEIALRFGTKILGLKEGKLEFFKKTTDVTKEEIEILYKTMQK